MQIQVALRWLIENERVLPIPGAKNGNRTERCTRIGDLLYQVLPLFIVDNSMPCFLSGFTPPAVLGILPGHSRSF